MYSLLVFTCSVSFSLSSVGFVIFISNISQCVQFPQILTNAKQIPAEKMLFVRIPSGASSVLAKKITPATHSKVVSI